MLQKIYKEMSLKARKMNVLFRLYCMKLRMLMEKKLS